MQRPASNDPPFVLEHHKIPHILANFRQRARQQSPIARVSRNQFVNLLGIRQTRLTRAHALPPAAPQSFSSHPRSPASLWPEPFLPSHHESPAPPRVPGTHKNPDRMWDSARVTPRYSNPAARISSPRTPSPVFQSAHAPISRELPSSPDMSPPPTHS